MPATNEILENEKIDLVKSDEIKKAKKNPKIKKALDKLNSITNRIENNYENSGVKASTLKNLKNVHTMIEEYSTTEKKKKTKKTSNGDDKKPKSNKGFEVLKEVYPNTLNFVRDCFRKRNEEYNLDLVTWITLTKEVNKYIKDNNLQTNHDQKHQIFPDAVLANGINFDGSTQLTYSTKPKEGETLLYTWFSRNCFLKKEDKQ